jgi:hypothetical protein
MPRINVRVVLVAGNLRTPGGMSGVPDLPSVTEAPTSLEQEGLPNLGLC